MPLLAIVDTGPIYAAADDDDDQHARCVAVLQRRDLELVIPARIVAELSYIIGRRLGPAADAAFLRGLGNLHVEAPAADDWSRIADLVEQYADFPFGGTDASVVSLAERLGADTVVTLDKRHFAAIRPRHCPAFRILPD
jgi:predicted nucleic acid-binding protein